MLHFTSNVAIRLIIISSIHYCIHFILQKTFVRSFRNLYPLKKLVPYISSYSFSLSVIFQLLALLVCFSIVYINCQGNRENSMIHYRAIDRKWSFFRTSALISGIKSPVIPAGWYHTLAIQLPRAITHAFYSCFSAVSDCLKLLLLQQQGEKHNFNLLFFPVSLAEMA